MAERAAVPRTSIRRRPRRSVESLLSFGPARLAFGLYRRLCQRRMRAFSAARPLIEGRRGLEVGGPSSLFARGGPLPIYAVVGGLDNCTFSRTTVWEGTVEEGATFVYDRRHPPGRQYIHEATDLSAISAAAYSFVLSSHTIEHCGNPLKALCEWSRVLEAGGAMVVVVPHRDGTFDHRRPVTTLAHLVDDLERATGEDDLTHLPEILRCHDLVLDPPAGDPDTFRARSERNVENRCLHHHVFDTRLVAQLIDRAGLQIVDLEPALPYHIVAVAQKPVAGAVPDNVHVLGPAAAFRRLSPFVTDRG